MNKNKIDNVLCFVYLLRSIAIVDTNSEYIIEKYDQSIGIPLRKLNDDELKILKSFDTYHIRNDRWSDGSDKLDSILYFIFMCIYKEYNVSKMFKLLKTLGDPNLINGDNVISLHPLLVKHIESIIEYNESFSRDYKILSIVGFDKL